VTKSFEHLLSENRSMMHSYASTLLSGDSHEAEDVVQEATLTAYDKFHDFNQGKSFSKWIRGIIRYKVLESRRGTDKRPLSQDPDVINGIDDIYRLIDQVSSTDQWSKKLEVLDHCVAKLKKPMRTVIEKFYQFGYTLDEIAGQMNLNIMTVGKRLSRSRAKIRNCVTQKIKFEDE